MVYCSTTLLIKKSKDAINYLQLRLKDATSTVGDKIRDDNYISWLNNTITRLEEIETCNNTNNITGDKVNATSFHSIN